MNPKETQQIEYIPLHSGCVIVPLRSNRVNFGNTNTNTNTDNKNQNGSTSDTKHDLPKSSDSGTNEGDANGRLSRRSTGSIPRKNNKPTRQRSTSNRPSNRPSNNNTNPDDSDSGVSNNGSSDHDRESFENIDEESHISLDTETKQVTEKRSRRMSSSTIDKDNIIEKIDAVDGQPVKGKKFCIMYVSKKGDYKFIIAKNTIQKWLRNMKVKEITEFGQEVFITKPDCEEGRGKVIPFDLVTMKQSH
jgi:hypothetical protein